MESIDLEFDHIPVHNVHKYAEEKKVQESKQYSAVWGTIVLRGKQDDNNGEESS